MKPFSLLSCFILVSVGLLVDLHAAATTTAPNTGYALAEQIIRSCGDEKTFDPSLKIESPLNKAEIIIALARLCPAFAEIFPDELAAAKAALAHGAPAAPAAPPAPAAPAPEVAHTSDDRRALSVVAVAAGGRRLFVHLSVLAVVIYGKFFSIFLPLLAAIVLQVINMFVDHFVSVMMFPEKSIPLGRGGGAHVACVLVLFLRECMHEICLVDLDWGLSFATIA